MEHSLTIFTCLLVHLSCCKFSKGFGIVLDTIDRLLLPNVTKNIQVLSSLKRLSQKIKIGVV